jgi:hypothetical protein
LTQSKFKDGDRVEWKDAGLDGRVRHVSEHCVTVEFETPYGPKTFSFESDGRVWCWCAKPQITKIEVPPDLRIAR